MSINQVMNINETMGTVAVTTVSNYITLPYTPEHLLLQHSGTAPVYVRAGANTTDTIILPTATAAGATMATNQSMTEILPNVPTIVNWSSTFATKNLYYISSSATTLSIKLTRGV